LDRQKQEVQEAVQLPLTSEIHFALFCVIDPLELEEQCWRSQLPMSMLGERPWNSLCQTDGCGQDMSVKVFMAPNRHNVIDPFPIPRSKAKQTDIQCIDRKRGLALKWFLRNMYQDQIRKVVRESTESAKKQEDVQFEGLNTLFSQKTVTTMDTILSCDQ
jgi:ATP-dependent 26S proteasome regulatory subunit